MAWDICITAEGWQDIRDELDTWTREDLVLALACDDAEAFDEQCSPSHERLAQFEGYRASEYTALALETLVDIAFERIETHNTCDNGGNGYYIDRDGYHQVYVKAWSESPDRQETP
jgi:hypothetical protein